VCFVSPGDFNEPRAAVTGGHNSPITLFIQSTRRVRVPQCIYFIRRGLYTDYIFVPQTRLVILRYPYDIYIYIINQPGCRILPRHGNYRVTFDPASSAITKHPTTVRVIIHIYIYTLHPADTHTYANSGAVARHDDAKKVSSLIVAIANAITKESTDTYKKLRETL